MMMQDIGLGTAPLKTDLSAPAGARSVCRRVQRTLGALMICCAVAACGTSSDDNEEFVETPVEDLYNEAFNETEQGNWKQAARLFDEVERQHPYSVWATKAQLMAAYSHYQVNEYDEALGALDRFIQLHPGNRDIAYAYYLRALSFYEQISDVARDQSMTEDALEALEDVVKRFPESTYAHDSKLKIDLTRDNLAGKEMDIGRWYQRQGEYLAAINRYRSVVEKYQTTVHVPEALHRLTETYLSLGVVPEAQMAAAVLGHNYPDSEWYEDSVDRLEGRQFTPERSVSCWLVRSGNSVF